MKLEWHELGLGWPMLNHDVSEPHEVTKYNKCHHITSAIVK